MQAQVSLYPLGQSNLRPAIEAFIQTTRDHGLEVVPGPMSTLLAGDETQLFAAIQAGFHQAAQHGHIVLVLTISNACPRVPVQAPGSITFEPIGHVENDFNRAVSSEMLKASDSRIVIDPAFLQGLDQLESCARILVLFHFHQSQGYALKQHPRGDQSRSKRGVFALRSPNRPNAIGATEVELISLQENVLHVRGLDAINGTPVLDIKPA